MSRVRIPCRFWQVRSALHEPSAFLDLSFSLCFPPLSIYISLPFLSAPCSTSNPSGIDGQERGVSYWVEGWYSGKYIRGINPQRRRDSIVHPRHSLAVMAIRSIPSRPPPLALSLPPFSPAKNPVCEYVIGGYCYILQAKIPIDDPSAVKRRRRHSGFRMVVMVVVVVSNDVLPRAERIHETVARRWRWLRKILAISTLNRNRKTDNKKWYIVSSIYDIHEFCREYNRDEGNVIHKTRRFRNNLSERFRWNAVWRHQSNVNLLNLRSGSSQMLRTEIITIAGSPLLPWHARSLSNSNWKRC